MDFQTQTLPVINTLNKIHIDVLTIDASTNELLLLSTHHDRFEATDSFREEIAHEEHELNEAIDSLNDSLGIYDNLIRNNFPNQIEFVIKIQEKSAQLVLRSQGMIELRTMVNNSSKLLAAKSHFELSEKEVFTVVSSAWKYGGTGLGLHLSMLLANELGGDRKRESVKGVGSKFTASISTGGLKNEIFTSSIPEYQYNITSNKPYLVENKYSGNRINLSAK